MRITILAALLAAVPANAAINVNWADLTSDTGTQVSGTIATDSGSVGVTFSGGYAFDQLSGGTDYWVDGGYTQGVVNRPAGTDLIALGTGGTKTITFDHAVSDVYIALVSWNGNTAQFTQPFEKVSEGCGYWGCGTFSLGADNTFVGVGEVHGVLRFTGTFSSVTFTDTDEYWHGLQIGIGGLAADPPAPVPEPGEWAMMGAGLALTGAVVRRRRQS